MLRQNWLCHCSLFIIKIKSGSLPPTLRQASINLLLKKDSLEKIAPSIISIEQTTRQMFAVEVEMCLTELNGTPCTALAKFGFGKLFISWIRLPYPEPQATVFSKSTQSVGDRMPLSTLLFAMAKEPLSFSLKPASTFTRILWSDMEFKLSLFVDDLLMFVSDPSHSIPVIWSIFQQFGLLSGYKIRISKCECFPINEMVLQPTDIPFKLSSYSFKYLAINVTGKFSSLFCLLCYLNQFWLPRTFGRINTVKMSI